MSAADDPVTVLSVPGSAADHLYREGSAKASFWEVLFGSRLAAEKRTKVSSLPDGTRRFDIPVAPVEERVLSNARTWFGAQLESPSIRDARAALGASRLSLVGLQPQGTGIASFQLRLEIEGAEASSHLEEPFRNWFLAERPRLEAILVPFGFTPNV